MSAAGEYIWQGLKPCLKMLMTIMCGYALTKKGLFPPAASKGLSQVTMNIGLPSLLFSSMVSSFNESNISNFGPLCLVAIIFQLLGFLMVLVIRELLYVPADFQWGVLMLGLISNWGNLPTAVVQSVATESPFNPATDPQLGIAYIAIFILIMNITFYGSGLYRVCGWDLRDDREEVPRTLAGRVERRKKQWKQFMTWLSRKRHGSSGTINHREIKDKTMIAPEAVPDKLEDAPDTDVFSQPGEQSLPSLGKRVTYRDMERPGFSALEARRSRRKEGEAFSTGFGGPSGQPLVDLAGPLRRTPSARSRQDGISVAENVRVSEDGDCNHVSGEHHCDDDNDDDHHPSKQTWRRTILKSISGLTTPITLGVILSLPMALVLPLKALFVSVPGWTGTRMPNAPDGKPPLSFFYDFTVFVGGMTIPGGLILLGASFARLKLSRERIKQMPIPAICAVTFVKLLVMPVIGILIILGFRRGTNLFPLDQKMLSFVSFQLAGTPSAVNQIVITALFVKEGQSPDTLAAFLLLQYAFLIIQSSALTAVSLWLISE